MREHRNFGLRLAALFVGGAVIVGGTFAPRNGSIARSEEPNKGPGSELYGKYCLACHGADGRGTAMKVTMATIPDFSDAAWLDGKSNPELSVGILDGKGTQMPAFNDRLTSEQTKELVTLIRGFKKAATDSGAK